MEPIYVKNFTVDDSWVDRYGRMKPSMLLYLAQEMGGQHSALMSLDYDTLASRRLFWAVSRHGVQIDRMPTRGETIRVETWPLPATRAAYPRSVIGYDENGSECFRVITLWVLMDLDTRRMILPGKSGIMVVGTLRGNELPAPAGLILRPAGSARNRTVAYSDLDRNGHMNNTRCMDWIADLMPSEFHRTHALRELTVCYLAEAREGDDLRLNLEFADDATAQVDATRTQDGENHRIFSAKLYFDKGNNA